MTVPHHEIVEPRHEALGVGLSPEPIEELVDPGGERSGQRCAVLDRLGQLPQLERVAGRAHVTGGTDEMGDEARLAGRRRRVGEHPGDDGGERRGLHVVAECREEGFPESEQVVDEVIVRRVEVGPLRLERGGDLEARGDHIGQLPLTERPQNGTQDPEARPEVLVTGSRLVGRRIPFTEERDVDRLGR